MESPIEYIATTILGKKGQVTVPKRYRDEVGLAAGSPLAVLRVGESLILLPEQTRFQRLCESIASVLASHGVTRAELDCTLPEVRKRIFEERYPGFARKFASSKHRRGKIR